MKRLEVGEVLPTCRLAKRYPIDNVQMGSERDTMRCSKLMVEKYNETIFVVVENSVLFHANSTQSTERCTFTRSLLTEGVASLFPALALHLVRLESSGLIQSADVMLRER